jgi:hypothetical protein
MYNFLSFSVLLHYPQYTLYFYCIEIPNKSIILIDNKLSFAAEALSDLSIQNQGSVSSMSSCEAVQNFR